MSDICVESIAAHPEQSRAYNTSSRRHRFNPPQRLAYSIREAAVMTGLSRSSIYVLLGKKKLASVRIGGRRLITHEAITDLLNEAA